VAADTFPRPGLDRREVEDYIASRPAVEWQMARSIVRRAIIVGPILVAVAGLLRGIDGLIAAALGVVIVVGYYALTGLLLSRTARISLAAYHAGVLFGFFIRLALIMVTMFGIARIFEVDRLALGFTVIAAYLGLLVWEAAAIGEARRTGERRSA